jgi:hypothetical protein
MAASKQTSGHCKRRFENFDQVLAEVRSLNVQPTRQLGNWSLGQICQHLGVGMRECVEADKIFKAPLWLRVVGPWIRPRILKRGLPRGFQIPRGGERLIPPPVAYEDGLATLESGIATLKGSDRRTAHPVFGRMNLAEWDQFHLRHAELHLSFIVPAEATAAAAAS